MRVCFGIDISGSEPVTVRAEKVRGRIVTRSVPTALPERGAVCAGSVSSHGSFIRRVEAPFESVAKAIKVLPTLLDIQLPFPLEDCVCEFIDVTSGEGSVSALGVGARTDDVSGRIAEYERIGADVQLIDHDGLALWGQALKELPVSDGEENMPRVVAHLSEDRCQLVLGTGRDFISAHSVRPDDAGRISHLLEVGLKGTDGQRIRWILSGIKAEKTEVVAEFMAIAGSAREGVSEVVSEPSLFLARALASRGLEQKGVNLRSGSLLHSDIMAAGKRRNLVPAVALLAAGLLLICANKAADLLVSSREDALNREFSSLASEIAGYNMAARGVHALRKVEDKVAERKVDTRPFYAAFGRSLTAMVGDIMKAGHDGELKYEVISISASAGDDDAALLIKGTASEWNGCSDLATLLRRNGYNVSIDRKDTLSDERIPFILRSGGMR